MPAAQKNVSQIKARILALLLFASLFFLGVNSLLNIDMSQKPSVLGEKTSRETKRILQLEKIVTEHPDYLPGIIELTELYREEKRSEMVSDYLERANDIDPIRRRY